MLETVGQEYGSVAHNKVDLDMIADLESVNMQWEGLLNYAENVKAYWPASAAAYVSLSTHAVPCKSSPSAAESPKTEQYAGLI